MKLAEAVTKAFEIASKHFNWLDSLLHSFGITTKEEHKELYISAFIHGFKHGLEEVGELERD
jgi:enoyl-[acyl-carrier-protein] reductase (NADH)